MSIRARIITLVVVCVLLLASVIAFRVQVLVSETALATFQSNAKEQALRINDIITTYLSSGERIVATLAKRPELLAAKGKLQSFTHTREPALLKRDAFSPEVRAVYDLLFVTKDLTPNVELVLYGQEDGGYIRSAANVAAGYDPRTRGWYKLSVDGTKAFSITDPYVSTTNNIVVTVSAPVKDQGTVYGVTGVDFVAQPLVDTLKNTVIGERGYFVLLDKNGMVVVDPALPFETIAEQYRTRKKPLGDPVFSTIHACLGGMLELTRNGVDYVAYVVTFDYVGWKGAVLLPLDEVQEGARSTSKNILLISAMGAFVMICLAAAQTTLITRPIYRLMDRLHRVADDKDFAAFDNVPLEKLPEIQNLNASAVAMIEQIRALIKSSEQKTQEAQEQRDKAEEALALAEESQKAAVRAQKNAELAQAAAEHANMAKSEFLANMSHEIRTPLNAVLGMTAIGAKTSDIEGKNQAFTKIEGASHHLLGVINDILDMSKIEAGKLEISGITFRVREVIARIENIMRFKSNEKEQELVVAVADEVPNGLYGDDIRLAQVITNLVGNAIKFTPEKGRVSLAVSLDAEEDGICTVRFLVEDTGIGITEEQKGKLFNPFQQAESSTTRKYGGTGLGLALCKRIVDLLGGEIHVDSELGRGSAFSFTIAAPRADMAPESEIAESASQAMQEGEFAGNVILLVDDVDINREIVVTLLEDTGIVIDAAENGKKAVELFERAPERYRLILMDVQMPVMDGYEASRRIRAGNSPQAVSVPIVAMTANVFSENVAHCLEAGMTDHVGKPLEMRIVLEKLRRYLPKRH